MDANHAQVYSKLLGEKKSEASIKKDPIKICTLTSVKTKSDSHGLSVQPSLGK